MSTTVERVCNDGAHCEPNPDDAESFVTIDTAVCLLGITKHSVEDLIRRGRLSTTRNGLVSAESIDAYLSSPAVLARRARDAAPKPRPDLLPGRFPIEALWATLERHEGRPLLPGEVALRVGLARGEIYRLIREGLTAAMADRLSIAAGYHPAMVWGMDWWDDDRHRLEGSRRQRVAWHPSARAVRGVLSSGGGYESGDAA